MAGEEFVLIAVLVVIGIFLTVGVFAGRYKRVPPDQAMVVYGQKRGDRGFTVISPGGGKFILPIKESYKFLSLAPRPLSFKVLKVADASKALSDVHLRVEYKVSAERTKLDLAAQHLLSRSTEDTDRMVKETVAARLRGICSAPGGNVVAADREGLAQKIRDASDADLGMFGLEIMHLLVVDILDSASLPNLGDRASGPGNRGAGERLVE